MTTTNSGEPFRVLFLLLNGIITMRYRYKDAMDKEGSIK